MLNHESAQPSNVDSLRNWIQTTGCLSRDETAYLGAEDDLLCVATQTDTFLLRLELLLDRALISGWRSFSRVSIFLLPPCHLKKWLHLCYSLFINIGSVSISASAARFLVMLASISPLELSFNGLCV